MITSRKSRKTRNRILMCDFHPDFTVYRARVSYRTNTQEEFTTIPFRCTGYDGQHFVKDIEIEDKNATSVEVTYILTVSLSGKTILFKDVSNLEVLKENEQCICVLLAKKIRSKTDVKNKPKRRKRLSPEEEEARVKEVEQILRSDPEVYNEIVSSSFISSESKRFENEVKNKTFAIVNTIKQICFDYMCEAQSTSKKQNLASALTCYTKIKELVKRNLSVISQSGEISKIKNLMCNMQSICMKLALEIHDEKSKTFKDTSELSEDTKNFVDSEDTSRNIQELSEDSKNYNDSEDVRNFNESIDLKNYNDSEDAFKNIPELSEETKNFDDSENLSPFVPFRQNFGFP